MTTEPTTPKTPDQLDEMRARAMIRRVIGAETDWQLYVDDAQALRQADEAAGIPTEGLLALMRGEAVIVPKEAIRLIEGIALDLGKPESWIHAAHYKHMAKKALSMISASPWAPKKE